MNNKSETPVIERAIIMSDGDMMELTNLDYPKPLRVTCGEADFLKITTELFYILTPKNLAIQRNPLRRIIGFTRRNLWKL